MRVIVIAVIVVTVLFASAEIADDAAEAIVPEIDAAEPLMIQATYSSSAPGKVPKETPKVPNKGIVKYGPDMVDPTPGYPGSDKDDPSDYHAEDTNSEGYNKLVGPGKTSDMKDGHVQSPGYSAHDVIIKHGYYYLGPSRRRIGGGFGRRRRAPPGAKTIEDRTKTAKQIVAKLLGKKKRAAQRKSKMKKKQNKEKRVVPEMLKPLKEQMADAEKAKTKKAVTSDLHKNEVTEASKTSAESATKKTSVASKSTKPKADPCNAERKAHCRAHNFHDCSPGSKKCGSCKAGYKLVTDVAHAKPKSGQCPGAIMTYIDQFPKTDNNCKLLINRPHKHTFTGNNWILDGNQGLCNNDYTVSVWAKPSARTSDWTRLIGSGLAKTRNYGIWISKEGYPLAQFNGPFNGQDAWLKGNNKFKVPLHKWTNLVMVYKYLQWVALYMDGVLVTKLATKDRIKSSYQGGLSLGKAPFFFHSSGYSKAAPGFKGELAYVRVYCGLSMKSDQVKTCVYDGFKEPKAATPPPPKCPAGSSQEIFNLSTNLPPKRMLKFTGNNYIMTAATRYAFAQPYTISVWIKPSARTSDSVCLFGKGTPKERNYGLWITKEGYPIAQMKYWKTATGWSDKDVSTKDDKFKVPLNTWTNLVMVYYNCQNNCHSAGNNKMYIALYMNGVLVKKNPTKTIPKWETRSSLNLARQPFFLSSINYAGKASLSFLGELADAKAYTVAMTGDQVKRCLYDGFKAPTAPSSTLKCSSSPSATTV
jgi:hypothetical protein